MKKLVIWEMIAIAGIVLLVIIGLTYENYLVEFEEDEILNPQVEKKKHSR